MHLKCAECSQENAIYVCHHCSRPLCKEDATVIEDWAFTESQPINLPDWLRPVWRRLTFNRNDPIRAAHCNACYRLNHSSNRWFYQLWHHLQAR